MDHNLSFAVLMILIAKTFICQMIINPKPISQLNLQKLSDMTLKDFALSTDEKYAFISSETNGINIVDFSDILNPKIIYQESYNTPLLPSSVNSVAVTTEYLFVVDRMQGMRIYNIENLPNVKLAGHINLNMELQLFQIKQSDTKTGFLIGNGIVTSIDLSNVSQPLVLFTQKNSKSNESFKAHLFNNDQFLTIANGNGNNGICIMDLSNKNSIKILFEGKVGGNTLDFMVLKDGKTALVIEAFYGLYREVIPAQLYDVNNNTPIVLNNWISVHQTNDIFTTLGRSTDDKYIFVAVRNLGLLLFSFEQDKFNIIEKIPSEHLTSRVRFTKLNNDQYLFVSTGFTLAVFEKAQPNFNKDFPNMFNIFQSSLSKIGDSNQTRSIKRFKDGKRLAIALAKVDRAKIFDVSDPYQTVQIYQFPDENNPPDLTKPVPEYDAVTISEDEKTIYLGLSARGVYTYDISDLQNLNVVLKSKYLPVPQLPFSNDCDDIVFDPSGTIAIISNGFIGFQVVNFLDKSNPTPIANFANDKFKCSFEKTIFVKDIVKNIYYIYAVCRDIGVVLFTLDFTIMPPKITILDTIQKFGAEQLVFSQDQNYIFAANGVSGVLIIDISIRNKLKLIKQLILSGWINTILIAYPENYEKYDKTKKDYYVEEYLIVGHVEKGELSLINIKNKQDPFVQATYENLGEYSFSIVQSVDNKSVFSIDSILNQQKGPFGMRYLPLNLTLTIHTQQRLLNETSIEEKYIQLPASASFKVGQPIQLTFVPVKTKKEMIIDKVYYYDDFEIKALPYWMNYIQSSRTLSLKIDKTATLKPQGLNTIILSVLVKVESEDFLTNNLIDQGLSKLILKSLAQQEYIDRNQYLKSRFDPNIDFNLNYYDVNYPQNSDNNKIQMVIKKVLINSYFNYPVQFKVEKALKINYKPFVDQNYIESGTQYVYIQFEIIEGKCVFVDRVYSGVLVSFSQDKLKMKIEGSLSTVNQILKNTIKSVTSDDPSTIKIKITLQDRADYDLITDEKLSNMHFISQMPHVKLVYPLQEQINDQYDNGDLYVEQKYSLKLFSNSFQNEDKQVSLSYSAFIFSRGNWTQLQNEEWISFNNLDLTFQGQKSLSGLYDTAKIKIIATDSYTEDSDTFEIKFSRFPPLLTIQIIAQVLAPIVGFLGIFKYRAQIYTILCRSLYYYKKDIIQIGKLYHREIILVQSYHQDISGLWKKINKKKMEAHIQEIEKQYQQTKTIDLTDMLKSLNDIYQLNQKKYKNIKTEEFQLTSSRLYKLVHSYVVDILLKNDKVTFEAYQQFVKGEEKKIKAKDWYQNSVTIHQVDKETLMQGHNTVLTQKDLMSTFMINKSYTNFPDVWVNDAYVQSILTQKYQLKDIDYNLISSKLVNDTIGYNNLSGNSLNPCKGQSIYLSSNDINSIAAFYNTYGETCYKLKKCFAANFVPVGFNKNSLLPKWLNYHIKDDTLILYGYPKIEDSGEILIRIYGAFDLPIMQFKIIVGQSQHNKVKTSKQKPTFKTNKVIDLDNESSPNVLKVKCFEPDGQPSVSKSPQQNNQYYDQSSESIFKKENVLNKDFTERDAIIEDKNNITTVGLNPLSPPLSQLDSGNFALSSQNFYLDKKLDENSVKSDKK